MDLLTFRNIRCFRGRVELPLAPLTFLVGENSTGKSTILAIYRLAHDLATWSGTPDFNADPFLLGAHEQLVRSAGKGPRKQATFAIGFHAGQLRVEAELAEVAGQPSVATWTARSPGRSIELHVPQGKAGRLRLRLRTGSAEVTLSKRFVDAYHDASRKSHLARWFAYLVATHEHPGLRTIEAELVQFVVDIARSVGAFPVYLSPIRSKPQRTYDSVGESWDPEGGHVPNMLARLHAESPTLWHEVTRALQGFGNKSGLFKSLDVERKGRGRGDPFQLQVGIGSTRANILDVGYGVSQALPILVETFIAKPRMTFLLQQPEVHLHPRAQAQLGTYFGRLALDHEKRFIVETHSDYLLDRICMDVRDGRGVTPAHVRIIYLERRGTSVKPYPLNLDELGQIVDPPPSYRQFFLMEQRRMLGV